MKTIKGLYENGEVKLLEAVPTTAVSKVLITFIEDENDDDIVRNLSLQQPSSAFADYLKNETEDLYQDYLKK